MVIVTFSYKCFYFYKLFLLSVGEVVYSNAEEELFAKDADYSFEFNVVQESDTAFGGKWVEGDVEMLPHRKVLFFKGQKFSSIVQKVKQLLA